MASSHHRGACDEQWEWFLIEGSTAMHRLVRAGRTEQRLALHAGNVLAAADGQPNARIAASLGVSVDTARQWRDCSCSAPGVASLRDPSADPAGSDRRTNGGVTVCGSRRRRLN